MKKKATKSANGPIESELVGVPFSRYAVYFFLTIVGCAIDLSTKQWIFGKYFDRFDVNNLKPGERLPEPLWLIEGCLGIETSTNLGALFGMGQGKMAWFAGLSILAIAGILFWLFYKKAAISWMITISLSMITGGILGNLYDRLGMWHDSEMPANHAYGVRDWIHFRWEGIPILDPWPNFNIADSLLVCGAILLLIVGFFMPDPNKVRKEK